jgi:acyl-CoA synthetase (AMP-forming)/AMP-acid ligase II
MTIGNILSRNAVQYPDREALVFEEQRFTWQKLNERVNRLADSFLSIGLKKGDKVALLSENAPACVEANYALAKIGVVYFPVLSRLLPRDIGYLIDLSEAKALIYQESFAPMVDEIKPDLHQVETFLQVGGPTRDYAVDYEAFLSKGNADEPGVPVGPDDPYIFLCTGGTTGISKIAILTHANALWAVYTTINAMNLSEKDTGIQVLPLFHVIINNGLNSFMAAGSRVVLEPRFDAVRYMERIHKEKVTVVQVVPPFLFSWIAAIPEAMAWDMSHVRVFSTAAASFPEDLKQAVRRHFTNAEIYYTYGLTETSGGNATVLDPGMIFDKGESIGVVNPLLEFRIVDEKGNGVGMNIPGELLLKGPSVISGYYKGEKETGMTFVDGWMHTGDVVSRDKQGFLYFEGRKKDMIKTGGENVFAKEVEDALLGHPDIQEAAVFGLPDKKWGEKIHAAVVLKPGQEMSEASVLSFAKETLPGFKCPKKVLFVPELPRNPSGKVLKYKLKDDLKSILS